ncbi:TPA: hypothetical protein ACH3X2_009875 [Trebouxia sp. C0005]|nr:MAG: mitochondrial GTPase 1-like [Trebouxia sp. A1-2]
MAKISWFGGHMARTVRELQDRLRMVDMVLEVRDARIPFSSANPELEKLVRHKRRLLVLNKADLAAPDKQQAILHRLEEQKLQALFTSSQKRSSIQKLLQAVTSRLQQDKPKADMLMIMAVGIPNSGKSTLINALRHAAKLGKHNSSGGKAATGATPGLTRHIAGFQVGERPTAFLMDTPGVMLPNVPNEQTGMRLALTGAVKDSIVGEERLVRHLLLELAQQAIQSKGANQKRMQWPGMAEGEKMSLLQEAVLSAVNAASPAAGDAHASSSELQCDDTLTILQSSQYDVDAGMAAFHLAMKQDMLDQDRMSAVYRKALAAYRTGDFGRYTLDSLP